MKKLVSITLASMLIMSASVTETFAFGNHKGLPPGQQKKVYLPPGIEKKFKDIEGYDWAERSIERMAIKGVIQGYGDGVYAPKKSVTKLEAIIMSLRVMGYEDLAKTNLEQIKKGNKKLKHKSRFQDWSYGYIAVALEKGILEEVDLIDMNFKEPAERHEVAKYIIRAIGDDKKAQKYMKTELRFIDAGAVPLGSVGYVYLADKKGIITGYPDKTYRPNRSVTRAEMAVLIARLDDNVDNDIDDNEEFAEIVKIRENRLTLRIDNKTKDFKVLDNTPVYTEKGKYVSLEELETGMEIKILLNDKGTIIFIEIKESKDEDIVKEYRGEIEEIDDDYDWIEVQVGSRDKRFKITNDTEVVIEHDKDGDIEDIEVEDKVKVKINEDNEVVYIKVYRELNFVYEGEVEEIDDDYDWIEVEVGNKDKRFEITNDTKVIIEDDDDQDIEDIEVGDEVKVKVNEDNEVEYIKVLRELNFIYEGEVEEIDNDYDWIKVEVRSSDRLFEITDDTEVIFEDDEEGDIEDIKVGDEVSVRVTDDNEVIYIKVDRELTRIYEGEVEEIDDDYDWIEVEIGNRDRRFEVTDDTEVVFEDDEEGDIEDIEIGDDVKFRVNADDEIEYIEVDRELDYEVYEGLFLDIDDEELSVFLSNKIKKFDVDSDVKVKFKDKNGDLEDLIEGDYIRVLVEEDDEEVIVIEVDRNYISK